MPTPEELRKQHAQVVEEEESRFQKRLQQLRQEGEAAVLAAESRAENARNKRAEIEAEIKDISAEMQEILEVEAAQQETLSSHLCAADIRTARAVLDAEVQVQSLRQEAELTTRRTFHVLHEGSHHARALQEQVGGLKEAVTGVTACQRDHQLQSIPKIAPRMFDLAESPFDGLGKFGSSRPLQVPKGFYADLHRARDVKSAKLPAKSLDR